MIVIVGIGLVLVWFANLRSSFSSETAGMKNLVSALNQKAFGYLQKMQFKVKC